MVRQIYRWCVEEHLSSYAIHRRLTAQVVRSATKKSRFGCRSFWSMTPPVD